MKLKSGFLLLLVATASFAAETRYASGLLRTLAIDAPREGAGDRPAVDGFLRREYGSMPNGYAWLESNEVPDNTHIHHYYELRFRSRRVVDAQLKVHYNRQGWVQYASSSWAAPLTLVLPDDTDGNRARVDARLKREFASRYGHAPGRVKLEPVVWIDERNARAVAAFEVTLTSERDGIYRRFLVEERSGDSLRETRFVRFASAKVYSVSPFDGSPPASQTFATVPKTSGMLDSDYVYVWREEYTSSATAPNKRDVDYTIDFSAAPGWSSDGTETGYNAICSAGANNCPNQDFDAVNVYYHLTSYRKYVSDTFAALGISFTFKDDPLQVIVNNLTPVLSSDGGIGSETNNAAFIPGGCRSDGSIDKCLVFLRPAHTSTTTVCGPANTQLHDLAREAVVVVHEFQHYVTDAITGLIPGSDTYDVGDAIHEGYSDYFAASHVSTTSGQTATLIGQYGFQNCTAVQRELADPLVFVNDNATATDPHYAGLTWASGLWQLRVKLGATVADRIAYKSLFFLPARAGFIDTVEALVQADQANNGGANAATIRTLFYDQLHWAGGQTGVFRDSAHGIAEIGFKSCLAVGPLSGRGSGATYLVLALWAAVTLAAGRLARRRS